MSRQKRSPIRRAAAATTATSMLFAIGACGDDDTNASSAGDGGTPPDASEADLTGAEFGVADDESITTKEYVGAIPDSDIYVAFAISRTVDGDELAGGQAYFCDGETVANWFRLVDPDDGLKFTAESGASFDATVEDDGSITATVPLGDEEYEVTAEEVDTEGEAGLYLADYTIDADLATDERGGWIVLPDGTQRGAIRSPATVLPGTTMNTSNTQVVVAGREVLLRAITHIIGLDQQS